MADPVPPRAFVAGFPVAHSRSPLIHGHWLAGHGIAGSYLRHEVRPDGLAAFVACLKDGSQAFVGGNITIPHKEAIFALADEADETARMIGVANTVWLDGGRLKATNTDAYGFAANLDQRHPGWDRGRTAVVLGAGGASRAVIHALVERGFASIRIANRTLARARHVSDRFGERVSAHPLEDLPDLLVAADLFVNTSSLGMQGGAVPEIDFSPMAAEAIVTDIVYVPLLTPILAQARAQGRTVADGLGMLLHQAVPGFEIWFGTRPAVTEELRNLVIADMDRHA